MKSWFLWMSKESEMESTPGKDAVKTIEMRAKDLEYLVNLPD